jgi:hypothetical protein
VRILARNALEECGGGPGRPEVTFGRRAQPWH